MAEKCGCWDCLSKDKSIKWVTWMVLCPKCGNKRCPHATNHQHECTQSNEPGQQGSIYSNMK